LILHIPFSDEIVRRQIKLDDPNLGIGRLASSG
jgi:hypothetical protein